MGLFDGKVVVVTGAGGGIGRCHALAFAAEGAKVVVNDLGGTRDGSGQSHSMADQVVEEIRKAGGQAVANYASVADAAGAASIVQSAVDAFGRIDVLVNNAGILRDKSILKLDEPMWDLVVAVHLKGTYLCTKAAVERMKEQGTGGRIINTTSYAGLKGNFGQGNYAAAKAGIWGFTLVAALEFQKMGVTVNCIAPMAKTRMTEEISMIPDDMKAEQISPMVLFLASDLAAGVTGRCFGIHGQQMLEYKMLMTEGVTKQGSGLWTPQEIAEKLETIGADKKAPAAEAAGAAAPATSKFEQIMMVLPQGFLPDKAGAWKANIHFDSGAEGVYSVQVEGGACRVEKGAVGSSTCKVKSDPDTLMGLFDGSVDPQKAFMAGKLKIDKIGDMMNFQKSFDRAKIAAAFAAGAKAAPAKAAAPAAAAPAAAPAGSKLDQVMAMLPHGFKADKAGAWKANIRFEAGSDVYSVVIDGGVCKVEKGAVGTPTCTVKTDPETLAGTMEGTVDANKAFMAGKFKVDKLGDMMNFQKYFDRDAVKAKLASGAKAAPAAAPAAAAPAAPDKPRGVKAHLGKFYGGEVLMASAEEMKAYAEAVGDKNPRYLDEERSGGIVAHPIFPVRYFHQLLEPVMTDPDLEIDLLRVVHGEQEMMFHAPFQPKDILYPTARLLSVEEKSSGQVIRIGLSLLREGRPVAEAITGIFVRGSKKAAEGAKKEEEAKPERGAPTFVHTRTVELDQTKRYAAASGDNNPIHLDEDVAKSAGLPGIILHGLCTMAMATQGVVDQACGGNPERLRRISVRFSKPVLLGAKLETRGWVSEAKDGVRVVEFETFDQDGRCVLDKGRAEISA